jgi:hypothetical protein
MQASWKLSGIISLFVFLCAFTAVGETILTTKRLQNPSLRARSIKPSTNSAKMLQRMRPERQVFTFSTTSPYEYRIVKNAQAEVDYETKLDAWRAKIDKTQIKEKEKQARLQKRERETASREQARRAEKEARTRHAAEPSRKSSLSNLFSRSEKSTVVETSSGKGSTVISTTGDRVESGKPKLSFWQRLKRAFFGA